jgi:hypothetical protein
LNEGGVRNPALGWARVALKPVAPYGDYAKQTINLSDSDVTRAHGATSRDHDRPFCSCVVVPGSVVDEAIGVITGTQRRPTETMFDVFGGTWAPVTIQPAFG